MKPIDNRNSNSELSISDISRSIVREYLIRHHCSSTLSAFEAEDRLNSRRIPRQVLLTSLKIGDTFAGGSSNGQKYGSVLQLIVDRMKHRHDEHKKNSRGESRMSSRHFLNQHDNEAFESKLVEARQEQIKNYEGKLSMPGTKIRPDSAQPFKTRQYDFKTKIRGKIKQTDSEVFRKIYSKLAQIDAHPLKVIMNSATAFHEKKQGDEGYLPGVKFHQKSKDIHECERESQSEAILNLKKDSIEKNKMDARIDTPHFYEAPFDTLGDDSAPKGLDKKSPMNSQKKLVQLGKKDLQIDKKVFQEQKISMEIAPQKCDQKSRTKVEEISHLTEYNTMVKSKTSETKIRQTIEEIAENKPKIPEQKFQQQQKKGSRPLMRKIIRKNSNQGKDPLLMKEVSPPQNSPIDQLNLHLSLANEEPKNNELPATKQIQQLSQEKIIKPVPQMKLIKKKGKLQQPQSQQCTKFKFDDNFQDIVPAQQKLIYEYAPFDFIRMVINEHTYGDNPKINLKPQLNYNQKKTSAIPSSLKKRSRPITTEEANSLQKVISQSGSSNLPKAWHQGFILSKSKSTSYGLKQLEGGPCGIIAAVQCYFLKHLLYCSQPESEESMHNQQQREICLVAAITDLLMKVRRQDKISLVLPNTSIVSHKLDFSTVSIYTFEASTFQSAFNNIWPYRSSFINEQSHGVTVLLYSLVMTKTPEDIAKEVDIQTNPLIGNHGHCTQELVNMFLTGRASSNCFDGDKLLDNDYKLSGIRERAQFGFLTVFETLKYVEVGSYLKTPIFPIWIICKQFHYHVVFAGHYGISEDSEAKKFDLVYYDGLYNSDDRIRITFSRVQSQQSEAKEKDKAGLPLIQQVLATKWGRTNADWNGSIRIL